MRKILLLCVVAASLVLGGAQLAAATSEIRFASVSWTGVTVKTELAVKILQVLGYKASNTMLALPVVYKALDMNEADVFMGNWMPSMTSVAQPLFDKGSVLQLVANMPGAQYTLAAPSYVVDGGLKDFADLAKYGDKLGWKIYGIEEGNDGNEIILNMIKQNLFGMGKFELVPSSEAGMLLQVQDFVKQKQWVVFLGWTPHYMNEIIEMKYLTGSTADTFGENDGMATVFTNVRKGFPEARPNVTNFLKNLTFPIEMMNQIMAAMHENKDLSHLGAGLAWLKQHPERLKAWLNGVTTADGKPALPVITAWLARQ
ncbi:ABC transporter substrate-binding protein [Megalodesulfovibrio paquesii]